jgi:hypothetical protein
VERAVQGGGGVVLFDLAHHGAPGGQQQVDGDLGCDVARQPDPFVALVEQERGAGGGRGEEEAVALEARAMVGVEPRVAVEVGDPVEPDGAGGSRGRGVGTGSRHICAGRRAVGRLLRGFATARDRSQQGEGQQGERDGATARRHRGSSGRHPRRGIAAAQVRRTGPAGRASDADGARGRVVRSIVQGAAGTNRRT